MASRSNQSISVLVPANPFTPANLQGVSHCLAALNVEKLMEWWPGVPHAPHRDPKKVGAIQRSLDWKRVTQIAAYLLQEEIVDAPDYLDEYFRDIYEPRKLDPGREWPPRVPNIVGYQPSGFPTFSNVLLHVNGATVTPIKGGAATLKFDENNAALNFSVIDGQHRINGAYLALCIRRETTKANKWEIPAEVFLDLDKLGSPPQHQAQIFIDVNSYQKKVDRSLVADLFPTARGSRAPIDDKERAQDLGRKLMLETGPLVGMIQIPGIKFGVKDVVTLATLNSAIEDALGPMTNASVTSLEAQASFLSQCLTAWLDATGRKEELEDSDSLDPDNVAYQGRVIVSFLTLVPACIWTIKKSRRKLISSSAEVLLTEWLGEVMDRAGLRKGGLFISKSAIKEKAYLGSGGMANLRDVLWAASFSTRSISRLSDDKIASLANKHRAQIDVGEDE